MISASQLFNMNKEKNKPGPRPGQGRAGENTYSGRDGQPPAKIPPRPLGLEARRVWELC